MSRQFLNPVLILIVIKCVSSSTINSEFACKPIKSNGDVTSMDCGRLGIFVKNTTHEEHFQSELPDPPSMDSKTLFLAFHHGDPKSQIDVHYTNQSGFLSIFPNDPKVTFILHGFKTSRLRNFLAIKDGLLNLNDNNRPDVVIVVDWRSLAGLKKADLFMGYKEAAKNAERIGREIAYMLHLLYQNKNLNPLKVHLIGFSLGAQAVGVAGRRAVLGYEFRTKLGRITGLDPAGPRFEDFGGFLNRDDAHFVDIIHTNAGNNLLKVKFGMSMATGHVDFYPNGGSKQPGCTKSLEDISCSHNMAVRYFEASLSEAHRCKFFAYKCDSWPNFEKSEVDKDICPLDVAVMGFYSFREKARGSFYLKTFKNHPYC